MNDQLHHRERCPRCAAGGRDTSRDNLAVYNDGHKHCYSCGLTIFASVRDQLKQHVVVDSRNISLPVDVTEDIDFVALQWLSSYDITWNEVKEFRLKWSPSRQMLIFPVYGIKEQLLVWQGRSFGPEKLYPKYFSMGNIHDVLTTFDQKLTKRPKDGIILVEDMISAIKVSRQYRVMPLFGSNVTRPQLHRMNFLGDTLFFWLDYDKAKESMALALKARQQGFNTGVIITEEDPKDYTDEEINNFVEAVI